MFFCNLCVFICIPCYVAFNCANILWSSKPIDRAVCGITCVLFFFIVLFLTQVYSNSFERQSSVKTFPTSFFLLPADALSRSIWGDSWNKHLVARKQRPWKNTEAFKPTELGHPTGREASIRRKQLSSRAYANFIHSVIKNIDIGVLLREERGKTVSITADRSCVKKKPKKQQQTLCELCCRRSRGL